MYEIQRKSNISREKCAKPKKKKSKRNTFNPTYSKAVKRNIGKHIFHLIQNHFTSEHK